ncbi:DUF6221 family protein [Streptomyces sp. MS191]|uniref:DUF6221 family protein n=1 Tax=Streptomyces sp. ms191 TaxID=1827978 RepID=UPI0011CEB1D2|nr:DUF6221 family protein [Streptomyces sp. ms191]
MGLVEFLNVRLDEDERDARANRGIFPSPGVDGDGCVWLHIRPGGNAVIARYAHPVEGYDDMAKLRNWADTNSGWTQARVLAEVDAKRRVLAHVTAELNDSGGDNPWWYADKLLPVLRLLALPYAEHPDYDEAWRP